MKNEERGITFVVIPRFHFLIIIDFTDFYTL